ncbi:hypothetical protein ACQKM2_01915 [Streptomyces sp. NPDC004126]|uniref:hypothetical protein n=1 Tax=Streptomyces sp. NPDC004126 TaxID=3390695 RepID=UPI003D04EC53
MADNVTVNPDAELSSDKKYATISGTYTTNKSGTAQLNIYLNGQHRIREYSVGDGGTHTWSQNFGSTSGAWYTGTYDVNVTFGQTETTAQVTIHNGATREHIKAHWEVSEPFPERTPIFGGPLDGQDYNYAESGPAGPQAPADAKGHYLHLQKLDGISVLSRGYYWITDETERPTGPFEYSGGPLDGQTNTDGNPNNNLPTTDDPTIDDLGAYHLAGRIQDLTYVWLREADLMRYRFFQERH